MSKQRVRSKYLTFALVIVLAGLGAGAAMVRFLNCQQPPVSQGLLTTFGDFEYARTLTKAEVIGLIGAPTSLEAWPPDMAECCNWEYDYPKLTGSDSFRLTLAFSRQAPFEVIAGGLYKNEESFRP